MSCLQAAIMWHQAGAAVVRTATDGTKRPLGEWKAYQRDRPHITEVVDWFSGGHPGIGLITGAVSGVEMLEFEGRAMQTGVDTAFEELCRNSGLDDLWDKLWSGYVEATPSGGLHFIYKTPSPLPNTKLARRPGDPHPEPLIETRGEGGFVVIAPSGGPVHPTGAAWEVLTQCEPHQMVELTAEERDAMFTVARALDEMPPPSEPEPVRDDFFDGASKTEGLTPGDAYEQSHTWEEILVPHGWDRVFKQGHTTHWRRPGKNMGVSATTGKAEDRDRLYVFSTSTPFEAETPVTKFYAYAVLNHGGDCKAAARALSDAGYGEKRDTTVNLSVVPTVVNGVPVTEAIRKVRVRRASEYTMKNPKWLWATENGEYGRIPRAALTLFAGKAGVGKTTLECTFAGWLTRGEMKGYYHGTPRDVLFVPYEDDIEETIVPRLVAAGADLERVHFLTMETLGRAEEDDVLLPTDCEIIGKLATDLEAAAIFVDPLSAALNVDNANDQKKVRKAAQAVQQMARKYRIAVLGIVHTRKAVTTNLLDAIMGSSEMGNVARAAIGLLADRHQPGTVLLSQEKNNGGRLDIPGYRYRIVPEIVYEGGEMIKTSRMEIVEKVEPQAVTAAMEEAAANPSQGRTALEEAKDFILDYLADHGGAAPRKEVIKAAQSEMLTASRATMDNAAKALKVTGDSTSPKGLWSMPA